MAMGRMLAVRGDRRGVRRRFPSLFLFKALHAAGPLQPSLRRLEGTAETEISVYTQPRRPSAPPGDGAAAEEAANRPPWLKAKLEITRPRAIVALGGATGLAVSRALGSRPPESVRGAFAGGW